MTNPFRAFLLRPWLLGAAGAASLLGAAMPTDLLVERLLIGWCVGVVLYVGLIVARVLMGPPDSLRRDASRLDDSAMTISLFAILATAASFGAVATLIFGSKDGHTLAHVALAAATMICAWAFVQVVFTVHYAHLYYGEGETGGRRGGLDFNEDDDPDFWDFLYFALTIGATSQTSDTAITTKPMRRVATVHAVYTYFFNTSVLALAINMAAGFVQH